MASKHLNIRYIKLHFTLEFPEDCILPVNKSSALRGGMGEMLLRANCISDRKCESCSFESECLVQRTMYSKFDIQPELVNSVDSVGYVVECEDYRTAFCEGDTLQFNLILFGKTIVYFNQILQAINMLGQNGLGKEKTFFRVVQVTNSLKEPILDGYNVYMRYYRVQLLSDYVQYRLNHIKNFPIDNKIVFKTPLTQKYNGVFLQEFNMDAIMRSIQRRVYILDCFENIDGEEAFSEKIPPITILEQSSRPISVRRYSFRKEQGMYLQGIKGEIRVEKMPEETLRWLLAGELVHIGKNTSFGFGRYRVE